MRANRLLFSGLVFAASFQLAVRHVVQLLDRSAADFFYGCLSIEGHHRGMNVPTFSLLRVIL
jgi:hypothetical protein